ncbi:MAG: PASTA domain-containing protein [Bacteroidetes bacterium]|nr:PASTA domain-containing protein [Bacteroidota bacterium]
MSFLGFLTKKNFYLHLVISVVLTLILLFIVLRLLKTYTNHGEEYVVPDFYGRTIEELQSEKFDKIYEFVVIDSIFDPSNNKKAIVIQNPIPGSRVKMGRKIYVTIVASSAEMVEMPDLIDLTLRQAINRLRSKGLRINRLEYAEDFADNAVLEQIYDNEMIEAGTMLEKGSAVNLVLGIGSNPEAPVPFLIGKTLSESLDLINLSSFNTGTQYFLDERDPKHVRVYRQQPEWSDKATLTKGMEINIWLRSDFSFDFDALIRSYQPDTAITDTIIRQEMPEEF